MADKIGSTELYYIILNNMPTSWSKGFGCKSTPFKRAINMSECMGNFKSIYERVVKPPF